MNLAEYKDVYVFAEQVDNKLSGIAFELLGKAKDLAADLDAKVVAVADRFGSEGSDRRSGGLRSG